MSLYIVNIHGEIEGDYEIIRKYEGSVIDKIHEIKQIEKDALYDIYMAGVNMAGDYHGCWVRFQDVEHIVNEYVRKVLEDVKEKI